MRLRGLLAIGCAFALVSPLTSADASVVGAAVSEVQEQSAITKARAKALAKAGVLKKGDLPGFAAERISREPGDAADARALYACLGAKVPKFAARNLGLTFTKDALQIDSSSDVLASVSKAKADLKLQASKKAPRCIKERLAALLEQEGVEIESLSVKPVDVKVKGADGASAYRYGAVVTLQGTELRLTGFLLTARVGQTEIFVSPGIFVDPADYSGPKPSLKQSVALARIAAKRVAAV